MVDVLTNFEIELIAQLWLHFFSITFHFFRCSVNKCIEVLRDKDGKEEIGEHPEKEEEKPSGPPGTILFGTLAMYMGERRPSQTQEDEKQEAGDENVEN